ncbi:hypothetical protein SAMN05216436_11431 [bacterium A37T11]|nr:hypothetical protein SAMN05216436_11431 [bacterium A37T11]
MKTLRIVMLAVLGLAGYVGAGAAAGANRQSGTLYHKIGSNNYEVVLASNMGSAPGKWSCTTNPDATCTYNRNSAAPISDSNAVQASAGNFVQH